MFSHRNEHVEEEEVEEDYQLSENQCHLCKHQLLTKDELWQHVELNHQEYFQDMRELAAASRT